MSSVPISGIVPLPDEVILRTVPSSVVISKSDDGSRLLSSSSIYPISDSGAWKERDPASIKIYELTEVSDISQIASLIFTVSPILTCFWAVKTLETPLILPPLI